jgi:hypothetical protein
MRSTYRVLLANSKARRKKEFQTIRSIRPRAIETPYSDQFKENLNLERVVMRDFRN